MSSTSNAPSSSSSSSSSPKGKKRRFEPSPVQPNTAQVHNLQVLHQKTSLSFFLYNQDSNGLSNGPTWFAKGVTTLYVIDDTFVPGVTNDSSANDTTIKSYDRQFALHLRRSCHVNSVEVETISLLSKKQQQQQQQQEPHLEKGQTTFQHFDPLERILWKPASSYTMEDVIQRAKTPRHEADAQSTRGATGMTNAIRAASIASNLGELRILTTFAIDKTADQSDKGQQTSDADELAVKEIWKQDILKSIPDGNTSAKLDMKMESRSLRRQNARLDSISSTMAKKRAKAAKLTIRYQITLGEEKITHLGGIHALTTNRTPHIYTTAGIYGDHEGPRTWIPIADSAATRHRSTHEITIKVTASMREGSSVVGFGEDYGVQETILHDRLAIESSQEAVDMDRLEKKLGRDHVDWLRQVCSNYSNAQIHAHENDNSDSPHVIPPELASHGNAGGFTSIDAIFATTVWSSRSWLPISPRSLGFAIGPFRVLEDPEYFGSLDRNDGNDSDNASEDENEDKKDPEPVDLAQMARENGEGIRQAYFAPIFARKHIHTEANMELLPDTKFSLSPLTKRQAELCEALDQSLLTSTTGIVTRALTLMRDILALPAFRTVSYTQIWIPHAVHGGSTSGSFHECPEAMNNPFLGGCIVDARLLPPANHRLPYHQGGRVIQFLQARCAIRGWIISAIPLGGRDDVGNGYIYTLIESMIMSLYERSHGAHGEGGGRGSVFFTKRFAAGCGLNSSNLDFLPIQNIEDTDFDVVVGGIVGAVPVEDRNNDQLWRSASNGTESHTSAMDEFAIRQLLTLDAVSALERGTDKDKLVPTPSMGWMGSHLSLSFLSSNANSSSELGCGALELQHPVGGIPYRAFKGDLVRRIVEGRAGIANFIRLARAAFVAAHLADMGHEELKYQTEKKAKPAESEKEPGKDHVEKPKPRFIICVNEILKKKGLSHTLFTRALQNISGRVREAQLLGTLVDVERDLKDPRTGHPFVDPEGFPNSYVRGASEVYLRVGVHVEPAKDAGGAGVLKGIQLLSYAEPVVPEGGIAYGGPITIRVVENEGNFREFVKDLSPDGSRRDWGSVTLHAKPVTLPKAQTAASGTIESGNTKGTKDMKVGNLRTASKSSLGMIGSGGGAFNEANIHKGGYQAIELIRITNLTPLLWVRVDPMALYGGKIAVIQPDACLAEMLFHDGDAAAQVGTFRQPGNSQHTKLSFFIFIRFIILTFHLLILSPYMFTKDALRALAERPLKIQGSVKVSSVYDVQISELPVRVLGDCLRGTPALHSSLPHTPVVRAQAALAIAQWQNNKAPKHRNDMGRASWVGLQLLIQYFRERFYNNDTVMPVKFNRVVVKKNDVVDTSQTVANPEGSTPSLKANEDDGYRYLDAFDEGEERAEVLEEADVVEVEEDEEYRVRSAVIAAVASIRAKDGMTPTSAVKFLEIVLEAVDAEMVGNLVTPDEEVLMEKKRRKVNEEKLEEGDDDSVDEVEAVVVTSLPYASSMLVADALLALCHINISPAFITDPNTGKSVQSTAMHPVAKLMEISRRWLEWELYRERIRGEIEIESLTGVSGVCYDTIAACAITALSTLSILRQSTTDPLPESSKDSGMQGDVEDSNSVRRNKLEEVAAASFYISIFDSKPYRSDVTRAACAQAITCICCAADRFESEIKKPVGLLTALEFIFERIVNPDTSPSLRHTLAQLMLDACSGKICSMQRVGAIGGRNDLVTSAARFYNGPLGACYGGDTGSAVVTNVNPITYPAASAVNDGARRGLKLMSRAGHPKETGVDEELIVRIARFATKLWRTINGEPLDLTRSTPGVCSMDGQLRCTLLALWQWLWPRGCFAVMQVQVRKSNEWIRDYKELGVDQVMKTSEEEKLAASEEEASLSELHRLVSQELDRQIWRGEMSTQAYEIFKSMKSSNSITDASASEQGIGQPLPPIERDVSFKHGGWIASASQQRRAKGLDGGTAITKIRIRKSADQ